MVAGKGFEPSTSGLWGQRANHCSIPQRSFLLYLFLPLLVKFCF